MQENNGRRNPFLLAPLFVLPALFVFGIASFFEIGSLGRVPSLILIALFTLISFVTPIVLSFRVSGAGWIPGCLGRVRRGAFAASIWAAGLMAVQSASLRSLLLAEEYDYRTYTLYGFSIENATGTVGAFLLNFLIFAVIPVLLEAVLFRGIILHEYRYCGVLLSSLFSSLLYAALGMSYAELPVLFLNGVLLSAVVFLTGNLLCSVLTHLLYTLYAMCVEKYFLFIAAETETRILLFFILGALGCVFAICFFGSAEKLLRQRGENEDRAPLRMKKGRRSVVVRDVLSAPGLWAVCFGAVLICVLHIFL